MRPRIMQLKSRMNTGNHCELHKEKAGELFWNQNSMAVTQSWTLFDFSWALIFNSCRAHTVHMSIKPKCLITDSALPHDKPLHSIIASPHERHQDLKERNHTIIHATETHEQFCIFVMGHKKRYYTVLLNPTFNGFWKWSYSTEDDVPVSVAFYIEPWLRNFTFYSLNIKDQRKAILQYPKCDGPVICNWLAAILFLFMRTSTQSYL